MFLSQSKIRSGKFVHIYIYICDVYVCMCVRTYISMSVSGYVWQHKHIAFINRYMKRARTYPKSVSRTHTHTDKHLSNRAQRTFGGEWISLSTDFFWQLSGHSKSHVYKLFDICVVIYRLTIASRRLFFLPIKIFTKHCNCVCVCLCVSDLCAVYSNK